MSLQRQLACESSLDMVIATSQRLEFFSLPAEIRNTIYQQVLQADKPLRFHASGCLAAEKSNRPDTAIMVTCKQMLAEARPVFYNVNSFFIGQRATLSHYLKATPPALRRLKCHTIRHVVLNRSFMLNVTRISELKRIRSLETLTIFEQWFERHFPKCNCPKYGIIFDAGRHAVGTFNGERISKQQEIMTLCNAKMLVENAKYTPLLKTMMFARPNVRCKVVYQGGVGWTQLWPNTASNLLTFMVSWDAKRERYVFQCESVKKDGRYL